MHVPLLQRSHVFLQVVHGIEHHKLVTLLGVIAVLYLVYVLNIPVDLQISTQQSTAPAASASSSGIVRPLTLLDDPRYAHEYATRAQYINERLDRLRKEIRADRTYVVSYSYASSRFGEIEPRISSIFEVGQEKLAPSIRVYQDFSRRSWLHLKRDEHIMNGFFPVLVPRCYGMELYDRHEEVVIGYIGVEYLKEEPYSRGNEMQLLRQTAASIEAGLLQPIEHLNSLEEK